MINQECDKYAWTFNGKQFDNIGSFTEEFKNYNKEIMEVDFEDFLFSKATKIRVIFEGIPEGEEDPDEDLEEIFEADSEKGFSFIELMYKFHHKTSNVLNTQIMDHVFYEGFSYQGNIGGTETVCVHQGS